MIDIRVTHDVANLSRSDMEDPDQLLNKAFEEKPNLHAANALANNVDNMPAIVTCVSYKSKSLIVIILVVLVIAYAQMFEKEITIGQKYVGTSGGSTHYQVVDTEGNNYVLGDSVYLLDISVNCQLSLHFHQSRRIAKSIQEQKLAVIRE